MLFPFWESQLGWRPPNKGTILINKTPLKACCAAVDTSMPFSFSFFFFFFFLFFFFFFFFLFFF